MMVVHRIPRRLVLITLFFAPATVLHAQATTTTTRSVAGNRAHDPSTIVECDGEYWCFSTGSGVRTHRSRDLLNWQAGPRALDALPGWTRTYPLRDDRLWAPDVIRAADGRYLLYYSASSFGKNTSAIGVASNATLDPNNPTYRWVDHGVVIASTAADEFNAIDPAVTRDADGKLWMSFGSFWSGIQLIELDPRTGKRVATDSQVYSLARAKEIEAPFIHRRGDGDYFLFVNFGLCCRGVKSTYEIRVGRAGKITGPYLDRDGKSLRDGGGTLLLGSRGAQIGPGHAGIVTDARGREWLSFHFYDAAQNGRPVLGLRSLTWDKDGWPVIGDERAAP
jgi:arabinan endo-1,5-alpha-L-arabinosidase